MPNPYQTVGFIAFVLILILAAPAIGLAAAGVKIALLIAMPEGQKRSGKSGTVVWKRNNQMRVFAFPRLVRNSFTTFIRSLMSNFSSDWNLLTQTQQDSWLNAKGYEKTDRLGNKIALIGKALYCSVNTNLSLLGVPVITDALPTRAIDVFASTAPVVSVGGATITMAPITTSINWGIKYWATTELPAGVNRPSQNRFRMFLTAPDSTAAPSASAIYSAYVARFGAPAVGSTIFVYAQFVGNDNGQDGGRGLANKVIVSA